jgi:hypothetical protein
MTWFPQLSGGSVSQFPIVRSRKWRDIQNDLESGSRMMLPDSASGQIEWRLAYRDLTDAETQKVSDLFTASQGGFRAFAFADPLANLLGWSEDLSRADWQVGLLQTSSGIGGPAGTQGAWSVTNGTAGEQSVVQTMGVPGDYVCCFSAYVRSGVPGVVTLARDARQVEVATGPAWTRVFVSGAGAIGTVQSTFSIGIGPGHSIDVWGLQVEPQPYPSAYKPTETARGIYQETYFGTDELVMRSDGVGRSSCEIVLTSRV